VEPRAVAAASSSKCGCPSCSWRLRTSAAAVWPQLQWTSRVVSAAATWGRGVWGFREEELGCDAGQHTAERGSRVRVHVPANAHRVRPTCSCLLAPPSHSGAPSPQQMTLNSTFAPTSSSALPDHTWPSLHLSFSARPASQLPSAGELPTTHSRWPYWTWHWGGVGWHGG
jgi:hypothetical protein